MPKPAKVQPLGTSARWIRMFVIANQGWGKTVFCGTAPDAIFMTTDPEGTISAHELGSTAEEWQCSSWEDVDEAYRWLRDEGIKEQGYKWLIIDNITEAQRMAGAKSMEISRKQSNAPAKLDEFIMQQNDYQRSQLMLLNFVLKVNDLPINVIYTSHLTGFEDSEGELQYSAAIHGQKGALRNQIVGYANITGMGQSLTKKVGDKEVEVRRMWFSTHDAYRGKDRFIALGRYKDDLTIPEMMKLLEAKRAKNAASSKTPVRRKAATGSTTAKATTARKRTAVRKPA